MPVLVSVSVSVVLLQQDGSKMQSSICEVLLRSDRRMRL